MRGPIIVYNSNSNGNSNGNSKDLEGGLHRSRLGVLQDKIR